MSQAAIEMMKQHAEQIKEQEPELTKAVESGEVAAKTSAVSPIAQPGYNCRVILTRHEGVWSSAVEVNDPSRPFTERDFNMLIRLLGAKRGEIKRQAYVAYLNARKPPSVGDSQNTPIPIKDDTHAS